MEWLPSSILPREARFAHVASAFRLADIYVPFACRTDAGKHHHRHNDVDEKGRLDLTRLAFDQTDPANRTVWIHVHDSVTVGEMPPRR
jgi:hypothetical protein